ncbi:MAG TPA: hypothetical protein VFX96_16765 [Pyrinomonadaceae bacterium]|nr:hypothetical protein [Pyrinomonadaceae bacterium]
MKEIMVKIFIFCLVLILLIVEVLRIQIEFWEIVIKIAVLVLTLVIIVVEVRVVEKAKKQCRAFIYQSKSELRSIVLCANDQGDETKDFIKVGEGMVPCDRVVNCFFEPL